MKFKTEMTFKINKTDSNYKTFNMKKSSKEDLEKVKQCGVKLKEIKLVDTYPIKEEDVTDINLQIKDGVINSISHEGISQHTLFSKLENAEQLRIEDDETPYVCFNHQYYIEPNESSFGEQFVNKIKNRVHEEIINSFQLLELSETVVEETKA